MTSDKLLAILTVFVLPMLAVMIPILIGQRYGQYRKKKSEEVQHAPVGAVVGAAFGLLAFMLAITFQIACRINSGTIQVQYEKTNGGIC